MFYHFVGTFVWQVLKSFWNLSIQHIQFPSTIPGFWQPLACLLDKRQWLRFRLSNLSHLRSNIKHNCCNMSVLQTSAFVRSIDTSQNIPIQMIQVNPKHQKRLNKSSPCLFHRNKKKVGQPTELKFHIWCTIFLTPSPPKTTCCQRK